MNPSVGYRYNKLVSLSQNLISHSDSVWKIWSSCLLAYMDPMCYFWNLAPNFSAARGRVAKYDIFQKGAKYRFRKYIWFVGVRV